MAIASRTNRASRVCREWRTLKFLSVIISDTSGHNVQIGQIVHHSWQPRLTWNKEHDASSEWAVEPLEGGEVGKGEDSCDDASKAWHGREDHESASGIPVGWGVKRGREHKHMHSRTQSVSLVNWKRLHWRVKKMNSDALFYFCTWTCKLFSCEFTQQQSPTRSCSLKTTLKQWAAINRSLCTGKFVQPNMEFNPSLSSWFIDYWDNVRFYFIAQVPLNVWCIITTCHYTEQEESFPS